MNMGHQSRGEIRGPDVVVQLQDCSATAGTRLRENRLCETLGRSVIRLRRCRWLLALALAAQFSVSVWAEEAQAPQVPYDVGTNERWAWDQISKNQPANFLEKCNAAQPDARPSDDCSLLKAQFVVDILSKKQSSDQIKTAHIHLIGASITGDIDLTDADFSDREFSIKKSVVRGNIILDNAKADKMLLIESTVAGEVSAEHFTTNRDLDLSSSRFEEVVNLNGAVIGGTVVMSSTKFKGSLYLTRVKTTADLKLSGAHVCIVDARYADIGGDLDLRGFQFCKLDLYGATVQKDLKIGQPRSTSIDRRDERSVGQTVLKLENTQVGNLVDPKDEEQLPEEIFADNLNLEGFSVSHLDNRHTADWWGKLFELNRPYSPHPYQRIAAAFAASGDGGLADAIRFRGRWTEVWQQFNNNDWGRALLSLFLGAFAGFGIGIYSVIIVLSWVAAISTISAFYLWKPSSSPRNFCWHWWASFFQLLPVVEITEFKGFFDQELPNMRGFKRLYFLVLSLAGWFLALVFVAAISGITEKS
jgi:hypothetical protein